jgi:hypothetical protein
MITDEDIVKAFDRIARTADGALIYAHFQKIAIGRLDGDPSDGALRADHGRRTFAHELMALMGKGIAESGGRTDNSTEHAERALVFAVRQPVAVSRRESFREHVARTDPELTGRGWND